MMEKFSVITRYLICIICIFLLFGGCDRSASTPARPKVVRKKIAVPQKKTVTVRKTRAVRVAKATPSDGSPPAYDPTGKIDPFEPVFQEKAVVVKKSQRKKRLPRTPLERISLSQLKLVGIIITASGNRALVEESTGKGYIIRKGTYVGTNAGKVVQINKYKVIVEEEFDDVFGKTKTRQRELKLPKPPGEF
jgi:type IV pilus assembly protein PilP